MPAHFVKVLDNTFSTGRMSKVDVLLLVLLLLLVLVLVLVLSLLVQVGM